MSLPAILKNEFSGYGPAQLKKDIMSGITVMAVSLPLALAFGVSSGATAQAGLITAIVAGIVIGGLSGASFQISGPTGAMAAILLSLFHKMGPNGVFLAGLLSGIMLILAAVCQFGKIVSIIPSPVVTGFTSGIALIIFIGQIDNFLGVHTPAAESSALKLLGYFKGGFAPNLYAVGIALLVMALMLLWPKKWSGVVPSSLVGLIVATIVATVLKFPVETIGEIPKTLLPESRLLLSQIRLEDISGVLVPAVSIAMLGMIESLLCGEVGSRMKESPFDANQELLAQGIGNIIIPFFGGIPATAAIARSSVAIKSGGCTRLVSVVHSLGLLLSMFLLAPVMSIVPMAALAGVLMVTAYRMNEWKIIRFAFSKKLTSAILKFLITMIATVILDLTQAILIGTVLACFLFIVQISSSMEISIFPVDEKLLEKKHGMEIRKPLDYIQVAYLSGPIFFGTVQQLASRLTDLEDVRVLVLSMRGVPIIDTSGVMELESMYQKLRQDGRTILLCGIQKPVLKRLTQSGLVAEMGEEHIFWSAEQAIHFAQDL